MPSDRKSKSVKDKGKSEEMKSKRSESKSGKSQKSHEGANPGGPMPNFDGPPGPMPNFGGPPGPMPNFGGPPGPMPPNVQPPGAKAAATKSGATKTATAKEATTKADTKKEISTKSATGKETTTKTATGKEASNKAASAKGASVKADTAKPTAEKSIKPETESVCTESPQPTEIPTPSIKGILDPLSQRAPNHLSKDIITFSSPCPYYHSCCQDPCSYPLRRCISQMSCDYYSTRVSCCCCSLPPRPIDCCSVAYDLCPAVRHYYLYGHYTECLARGYPHYEIACRRDCIYW